MSQLPGQPAQGEESVDPALVSAAERLRVGEGEPGHQAAGHQLPVVHHNSQKEDGVSDHLKMTIKW